MFTRRLISDRLQRLASVFPVVAVVGARRVGKTTLLRPELGDRAEWIQFDAAQDVGNARADPDLFLANHPPPVILDEIQFAPELVAALKRRIDQDRTPGQYLLTVSQQWQVTRQLAESLAGRVVFLDLEGFCLAERADGPPERQPAAWLSAWLDDPQGLVARRPGRLVLPHPPAELVWRGTSPEATRLPTDTVADYHLAYFRTYVERDVRRLAELGDWQTFGRFVRLAAALTAQEVNASQLGRDIGVTPQTARRWLDLLHGAFQWFELLAFATNAVKRVSGKAKGYLADTGVAAHAQAISSPTALGGHPLWGPLFETFVVIVKSKSRIQRADARGIRAFRDAYPELDVGPGLVIAPCERLERISEDDYAMPWDLAGPLD